MNKEIKKSHQSLAMVENYHFTVDDQKIKADSVKDI